MFTILTRASAKQDRRPDNVRPAQEMHPLHQRASVRVQTVRASAMAGRSSIGPVWVVVGGVQEGLMGVGKSYEVIISKPNLFL